VRVELRIDSYTTTIETRDPETMARWLVEWFADINRNWTPATYVQIYTYPSRNWNAKQNDWIANQALNSPVTGNIRSAREFVNALTEKLNEIGGYS